jgi:hypothetical protein
MLKRLYQIAGVVLLAGYGLSSLMGWEFGRAVLAREAPGRYAVVSRGWWGYSSGHASSGGTRSGWGGGGSGGK